MQRYKNPAHYCNEQEIIFIKSILKNGWNERLVKNECGQSGHGQNGQNRFRKHNFAH